MNLVFTVVSRTAGSKLKVSQPGKVVSKKMSITSPYHKNASLPVYPKCNQNNNKNSLFAKLGCAA